MRRSLIALGALVVMVSATGVAFAAFVECQGGRCEGTDRPDRMVGSEERDGIYALGNRDQVDGEDGPDDIHGGDGPDDLCGQEGADWYGGSTQGDVLAEEEECVSGGIGASGNGDSGPDVMSGGSGADIAFGGDGPDEIFGEDGADSIGTGEQRASLFGGDGEDFVSGGDRGDSINGGDGDDLLRGNGGNDFIDSVELQNLSAAGGPGDGDVVNCGPGIDEAVVDENDEVRKCERVREGEAPVSSVSAHRAIAAFRAERGH